VNEGAAVDQAHARLHAILKAVVAGRDVADAASREAVESETLFQCAGALVPPYDPEALCLLVEHSNALRQNSTRALFPRKLCHSSYSRFVVMIVARLR
jgi:hypothetical protein